MKIAVLGCGARGMMFSNIAKSEKIEIAAACDIDKIRTDLFKELFQISEENLFNKADDFFGKGKLADVLIISTVDDTHHKYAIKALQTGYDILLEKPIALNACDVMDIYSKAKELNRKVGVCHVLRYTPFYMKVKELLDSGVIGEILNINQTENVGYWHFAHSFVRGNWHNSVETCPSILAKCCHDLDLILWLTGKSCKELSSFGNLIYFTEQNMPDGAAKRCKICKYKKDCLYSAYILYKNRPFMVKQPSVRDYSVENAFEVIDEEKDYYDKCVYQCDNDVCDHQMVNMLLEGGVLANLTMQAFSDKCYRRTQICGTKGEMNCLIEDGEIKLELFGEKEQIIHVTVDDKLSQHCGGDRLLLLDFLKYVAGNEKSVGLTTLGKSIESHMVAFAAENSRLNSGKPEFLGGEKQ